MIPDFQTLMLPLLRVTADGAEHTLGASADALADQFKLTAEERAQRLPKSPQWTINNRVGWASFYLRTAQLLIATGRGRFRITARGLSVLKTSPPRIDIGFLEQFPEFKAFRDSMRKGDGEPGPAPQPPEGNTIEQTPEEAIASSYAALRAAVEQELLTRLKSGDPEFFEQVVVQVLVAMGYGGSIEDAGAAIGKTGDGGIDGVIKEDRLGLDTIFVQAKRWEGTVGRPTVQAFAGSLDGQHARRGVLMTTSSFSADAQAYVKAIEKRIVLIDGPTLARLMFDFGVGVEPVGQPYVLKRVDLDFFGSSADAVTGA